MLSLIIEITPDILTLVSGLILLVLTVMEFTRNRRRLRILQFYLFMTFISSWVILLGVSGLTRDLQPGHSFPGLAAMEGSLSVLTGLGAYVFGMGFPRFVVRRRTVFHLVAVYLVALAGAAICWTKAWELDRGGVFRFPPEYPGPYFWTTSLMFVFTALGIVALLMKRNKETYPSRRAALLYAIVVLLFPGSIMFICLMVLPAYGYSNGILPAAMGIPVASILAMRGIFRSRYRDLRRTVSNSAIYLIAAAPIIGAFYLNEFAWEGDETFSQTRHTIIVLIIFASIVYIRYVYPALARLLSDSSRRMSLLLTAVTKEVEYNTDDTELVGVRVAEIYRSIFECRFAAVHLFGSEDEPIPSCALTGKISTSLSADLIEWDGVLRELTERNVGPWSPEFAPENRDSSKNRESRAPKILMAQLRTYRVELMFPIVFEKRALGMLFLGPRENGNVIYTPEQEAIASSLGSLAIGLKNHELFRRVFKLQEVLRRENTALLKSSSTILRQIVTLSGERKLVYKSEVMAKVVETIRRHASNNETVMILGETGTGKEMAASMIHQFGARSSGPFLAVNCAALPETLLESELFGHEKGAFTGAVQRRAGLFEQANGGTLFLDEIGDVSPAVQTRLLRVLQERSITRLGGNSTVDVDVRVISATNRDLNKLTAAGDFRDDLFYRLNVLVVRLPPLRERREDIPVLTEFFLSRFSERFQRGEFSMNQDALDFLYEYDWPGNIRQLENVLLSACAQSESSLLQRVNFEDLRLPGLRPSESTGSAPLDSYGRMMKSNELRLLKQALADAGGNKAEAARALGVGRSTMYRKMRKYGLEQS